MAYVLVRLVEANVGTAEHATGDPTARKYLKMQTSGQGCTKLQCHEAVQ